MVEHFKSSSDLPVARVAEISRGEFYSCSHDRILLLDQRTKDQIKLLRLSSDNNANTYGVQARVQC